jgi:D-alanyl-D-alanine carboxypeptidase
MVRVSVEASRRLRWGCLLLTAVVTLLAITDDPADARHRRKRHQGKHHATSERYNPPYADIVVDARSGAVLHQASADSARHPASLTKIMTLYLLFERLDAGQIRLDTEMPVSEHASEQAPTKLGLSPGSTIAVEDAIKGLVTKSANDAAVVVAEKLGGSEDEFARMMTRKARALGMRNTIYRNASGLPDDEQVSTARDQALLGIAIQERFPRYYRYFSTRSFVYHGHVMRNHNHLLGRVDGIDGIKTGFTRASGFNLVTSVRRGPRHLVAVVLGGRSGGQRDARMSDLIASNIDRAATKDIRVASVAAQPEQQPAPVENPKLATAASTPLLLTSPTVSDATAAIAHPGSNAPIKPVRVKTVAVKLVPPKHAAVTKPEFAAVRSEPFEPVRSEPLKAEPLKVEPVKPQEAVAPSPPPAEKKTALASAFASARNAIVPTAKAEETHHVVHRGWVIQVGAYEDENEARQRLTAAQSKAEPLLGKAEPYTEKTTKGDKTYFRARFAGFDRDRAEAACRKLKRNEIACMALKI